MTKEYLFDPLVLLDLPLEHPDPDRIRRRRAAAKPESTPPRNLIDPGSTRDPARPSIAKRDNALVKSISSGKAARGLVSNRAWKHHRIIVSSVGSLHMVRLA
ncbi:unannotated protein [freshwater metagenome]|uniref:Unannotated protein n=1 Tax=freshwater metagenome TaxID=449393 RepID=A0A6J6ZDV0_9ZZZZ